MKSEHQKTIYYATFFSCILLLCSACASRQAPTTQKEVPTQVMPTSTLTVVPTLAFTPTVTVTSTSVPSTDASSITPTEESTDENRLSPEGPWLVYKHADEQIFAINSDVNGRTLLPFEMSAYAWSEYAGSSAYPLLSWFDESDDRLFIYFFPELSIKEEIDLLSCPEVVEGCVLDEMNDIAQTPRWSPDGRYLAFSAAIEGPSTDLYVYDPRRESISRLTSGSNQIGHFWWSPDSRWIVHEEVSHFHGWCVEALWAAAVDGSKTNWLYTPPDTTSQSIAGWLDDERFVSFDHGMEGNRNIRLVSIEEGALAILFPGYFTDVGYGFDPSSGTFAFDPYIGAPDTDLEESGIYYVSVNSTTPTRVNIEASFVREWDEESQHFLTHSACPDQPEGVLGFDIHGVVSCIPEMNGTYSPDHNWYVDSGDVIRLYSAAGELVAELAGSRWDAVIWRPDSKGFVIFSRNGARYVGIEDVLEGNLEEEPVVIDQGPFDLDSLEITWVGE